MAYYFKKPYHTSRAASSSSSYESTSYNHSYSGNEYDYNRQQRIRNQYESESEVEPESEPEEYGKKTVFESRGGKNPYAIANGMLEEEDDDDVDDDVEYASGRRYEDHAAYVPTRAHDDDNDVEGVDEDLEPYEENDHMFFCKLFLKLIIIVFIMMICALVILFFRQEMRPEGSEVIFKPLDDKVSDVKGWIDNVSDRVTKSTFFVGESKKVAEEREEEKKLRHEFLKNYAERIEMSKKREREEAEERIKTTWRDRIMEIKENIKELKKKKELREREMKAVEAAILHNYDWSKLNIELDDKERIKQVTEVPSHCANTETFCSRIDDVQEGLATVAPSKGYSTYNLIFRLNKTFMNTLEEMLQKADLARNMKTLDDKMVKLFEHLIDSEQVNELIEDLRARKKIIEKIIEAINIKFNFKKSNEFAKKDKKVGVYWGAYSRSKYLEHDGGDWGGYLGCNKNTGHYTKTISKKDGYGTTIIKAEDPVDINKNCKKAIAHIEKYPPTPHKYTVTRTPQKSYKSDYEGKVNAQLARIEDEKLKLSILKPDFMKTYINLHTKVNDSINILKVFSTFGKLGDNVISSVEIDNGIKTVITGQNARIKLLKADEVDFNLIKGGKLIDALEKITHSGVIAAAAADTITIDHLTRKNDLLLYRNLAKYHDWNSNLYKWYSPQVVVDKKNRNAFYYHQEPYYVCLVLITPYPTMKYICSKDMSTDFEKFYVRLLRFELKYLFEKEKEKENAKVNYCPESLKRLERVENWADDDIYFSYRTDNKITSENKWIFGTASVISDLTKLQNTWKLRFYWPNFKRNDFDVNHMACDLHDCEPSFDGTI